ncbi:unnamed protein product [Rhizoctonia solani]|nr:unnamed protein product [Rhizoctonia solani]
MQYIEQMKADKKLQEQYDKYGEQTRQAVINFVIDIVPMLLSVSWLAGILSVAARAAQPSFPFYGSLELHVPWPVSWKRLRMAQQTLEIYGLWTNC